MISELYSVHTWDKRKLPSFFSARSHRYERSWKKEKQRERENEKAGRRECVNHARKPRTRWNEGSERGEWDERERACTWWHVERRGSWEGPAHQTTAIHLAHGVLLSPTLVSRLRTLPYSVPYLSTSARSPLPNGVLARVSRRRLRSSACMWIRYAVRWHDRESRWETFGAKDPRVYIWYKLSLCLLLNNSQDRKKKLRYVYNLIELILRN